MIKNVAIQVDLLKVFKYALITSNDVENSFSVYQSILAEYSRAFLFQKFEYI